MSDNDQADGFFDNGHKPPNCEHPECQPFEDCHVALTPQEPMGAVGGRQLRTVSELSTMPYGMRLARGFAILSGNKHDL